MLTLLYLNLPIGSITKRVSLTFSKGSLKFFKVNKKIFHKKMKEFDIHFMQQALLEAKSAFTKEEVPIGAVLIFNGKIIARAHNLVESSSDATAHAELLCLKEGAKKLGNWRLSQTTLYSTLEPCPMCAGAMIHSRIQRLVWGAPDLRCGAHGSWVNLLDTPHPIHQIETTRGILQEECADLMRTFFKQRREDAKTV